MRLGRSGFWNHPRRRLAGFLLLSLGAHALAFSFFRDPGEFDPIPPPSPGRVFRLPEADLPGGYAEIFEPSAIVFPGATPLRLAEPVMLPWQKSFWAAPTLLAATPYRPDQLGTDAPLAVRAQTSLGKFRGDLLPKVGPAKGRPVLETWWEVGGELKSRKVLAGFPLPTLKTSSALAPTAARIGVDEDGLPLPFSWHRFCFVDGWRMASLTPFSKKPGVCPLSPLRGPQPAGTRLAHPALPPLWRPAPRGEPRG